MNATSLSQSFDILPPYAQREVIDFIEFLTVKYAKSMPEKTKEEPFSFSWEGKLAHQKENFTSVELQHQAGAWRGI